MPKRSWTAFPLLLLGLGMPTAVAGQVAIELSPDTTIAIGGEVLGPDEVGQDDLAGTVVFTGVGVALLAGTNVNAFGRTAAGDALFSTDVTVDLSPVVARPGDVVQVTGGVPSLAFDAGAKGLPAGVQVDAVAEASDGSLLVSFDVTAAVDGTTFGDEDVARLDATTGVASLLFDGSAQGAADGLDLDALDVLADGSLLLSFDGSGALGGVAFDDEDLLSFDAAGPTFQLAYDGSLEHGGWSASDLDAADASETPDADGDGVADAVDNCAFTINPSQADTGGVGLGSAPDGIGDACQCGDVNDDGFVTGLDGTLATRASLNLPPFSGGPSDLAAPQKCDVSGDSVCSGLDGTFMKRASLGLPPSLQQSCDAAVAP
ncbi:MAG: hypothetical protein CL910_08945 [Deltaproteobacteria bacterium]|jgi:hypothetical protein|nr:hypothetical protein [Deltaproteobacteria bacterium]